MVDRLRARAMMVAAIAVSMGACLFPSLDSLSGASDSGADVSADTQQVDAQDGGPTDAGSEALPFSCSQVDAKFCDDFDDSDSSVFSRWAGSYIVGGATATRAPSDASPPFAAQFTTPSTPGTSPYALLHRDLTGVITTSAHFAFDLRIDKFPSSAQSFFSTGAVALSTANGGGVGLDVFAKGSLLQQVVFLPDGGTEYPTFPLALDPPLGKWVHVDIILAFGSNAATVQVLFDGKTALAPTNVDGRIPWGTPEITIGETYADPNNDGTVFLTDNVTFDFQ